MYYTELLWLKTLFQLASTDMAILSGKMPILKMAYYLRLIPFRRSHQKTHLVQLFLGLLFIRLLFINARSVPILNCMTLFKSLWHSKAMLLILSQQALTSMGKKVVALEKMVWKVA